MRKRTFGVTKYGSELKRYIIENQIDSKNQVKIPVRDFLSTWWKLIGGSDKSPGIYTYYINRKDVVEGEPYSGEPISDELIYRYAIENDLINKNISYLQFSRKTLLNEEKSWVRYLCKKLEYSADFRVYSLEAIENLMIDLYGEDEVKKIRLQYVKNRWAKKKRKKKKELEKEKKRLEKVKEG